MTEQEKKDYIRCKELYKKLKGKGLTDEEYNEYEKLCEKITNIIGR